MAGYRRFVTYLFQYEYDQKSGNCGFAKVEARQDRCRVELQVKSNFSGEYPVYLFTCAEGALTGVRLGDIPIRNGSGEAVFLSAADSIGGTPYGIDDMRGLYIPQAKAAFIASQWDDEMTDWSRFSPYEAADAEEEKTEAKEMDSEKDPAEGSAETEKGERDETSVKEHNEGLKEDALRVQKTQVNEEPQPQKVQESEGPQQQKAQENEEPQPQGIQDGAAPELQGTQAAAAVKLVGHCANAWERQWQQFSALHPIFRPYDEDALVWGVKLDLRDFKFLPQQYRYLANNSFLLHGFFNYRYVVFGYEGEEDKRWFLGVPGVFHNQEQLLAGVFGFPEFRTKQPCVQRTGEFGYWYRYLEL